MKIGSIRNNTGQLIEVERAETWEDDALCVQTDPEAFFPDKGGSTRAAKKICAACSVRNECLETALRRDEKFGIFGGLSERERRKVKKQQRPERSS